MAKEGKHKADQESKGSTGIDRTNDHAVGLAATTGNLSMAILKWVGKARWAFYDSAIAPLKRRLREREDFG